MSEDLLNGPNIRLRALEPGDVDLLYQWENDTSVWKVTNTLAPYSRFQIEEYVLNAQNNIFAARQLRLMIMAKDGRGGETPAGAIDLFDFDPFHFRAGVGILILEQFRDKGIGLESMQVMIRYVFGTLNMHQLFCNISPDNEPSLRLFEKLGFARCGIKRGWINDMGTWKDEWMFQLVNDHE